MSQSRDQDRGYRPDIQAVRTIGAGLVAVFHIWLGRVSGGVDVFFVISGFLITGSLHRELQKTRGIDVLAFWARIAQRIAPLGYLVLTATTVAILLWMPRARWESVWPEMLYSAFHLENIKLMMNSVDYLARDEPPSPVQQFWALSVQVQFYVVWPFLLLAVSPAAKRVRSPSWPFGLALLAVFAASLSYSIYETHRDPSPAYFNTLARVWEFALGGLVAIVLPHVALPPGIRSAAGWIGLAGILSCGFVLPQSAAFPGYVALLPTVGAALVLISGGGTGLGVGKVLSARPLVALGDIAFAFYLWHWPVLVFALILTGQEALGLAEGLAVIGVALIASFVTTRWVEPAFRRPYATFGLAFACRIAALLIVPVLVSAIVLSFASSNSSDAESESALEAIEPHQEQPNPLASSAQPPQRGSPEQPRIWPLNGPVKCHQARNDPEPVVCGFGELNRPTKTIALVGGSHSAHWIPAFRILAKQNRWRVLTVLKGACTLEVTTLRHPSCTEWNDSIHGVLQALRPDAIFTTSTRSDIHAKTSADRNRPLRPEQKEVVPLGYLDQWRRLADGGISIIAVRDTPRMKHRIPECLERHAPDASKCAHSRDEVLDRVDPTSELRPMPSNVSFIDMTDQFCDFQTCHPIRNGMVVFRDRDHISHPYSASLAPVLGERIKAVRPDLFPADAVRTTSQRLAKPVE